LGTYRLRVPASRVLYVPEAQGGLPPGPHVPCVLGTRASLGRSVRTARGGTLTSGWLVISSGGASASDLAAALGHESLVAYLSSHGSEMGHSPHSPHSPHIPHTTHTTHTPQSNHSPHSPHSPPSANSANSPQSRLVAPAAAADVELVEIGGVPGGAPTLDSPAPPEARDVVRDTSPLYLPYISPIFPLRAARRSARRGLRVSG